MASKNSYLKSPAHKQKLREAALRYHARVREALAAVKAAKQA